MLKAVDTRHDRLVALKVRVVPPDGSVDDLLTETRALLSLPPHPALAHARDDFYDGNRQVLVLRTRRLPVDRPLLLVREPTRCRGRATERT